MPDDPPVKRARLAERPRVGTCVFADRVARCAVDAYERLPTSSSDARPLRTVLAAFVVHDDVEDALTCVALGVGTKTSGRRFDNPRGARVIDAHAEVLARRALKRWTWRAAETREGASPFFARAIEKGVEKLVMRSNVSLHLYISSAPCGNACVRRWAKGRARRRRDDLGRAGTPREAHEPLSRSACDAGQVALCVKIVKRSKDDEPCARVRGMLERGELAPGTAPVGGDGGEALTCSDKLCVWNVVGYQGALLRRHVRDPMYVRSITIGRKYSEPHAHRALCCRADGFRSRRGAFATTHPATMETAVTFDDTPMDADEGAVFDTPFAMTWSLGDEREDVLNGRTGMTLDDEETPSSTCQAAFFAAHARLAGGAAEDVEFTPRAYADAKREADEEYDDAKNDLFAHPKMFEPRRDFPGWHEKKSLRASGYERRHELAIRLGAADRASV